MLDVTDAIARSTRRLWALLCTGLILGLGLFGCERSKGHVRPDPDSTRAARPKPKPVKPVKASLPPDGPIPTHGPGEVFIGQLVKNVPLSDTKPSEYCLEDGFLWRGAPFRLDRINVMGLKKRLAKVTPGSVVAIAGTREPSLDSALVKDRPCPDDYRPEAVQMRSDWVADEGGHRTTHAQLARTPFIRASAHRELSIHEIVEQREDGTMRVRITNPVDAALDPLDIKLHYEGGPGKPMPKYLPLELVLDAGESTEVDVARTMDPDGKPMADQPRRRGKYYRLYGIVLRGKVGRVHFDVELGLLGRK